MGAYIQYKRINKLRFSSSIMVFIEQFFEGKKEIKPEDIEFFVFQRIEENLNLDYKDSEAYNNADKLAGHVASFANSGGGLIILGVNQDEIKDARGKITKIYPKEVNWGEASLNKERLENKLASRINPPITGLIIKPVRNEKDKVIFLIDIPKSDFAPHMSPDHKYNRRTNFGTMAMEHYEVANLFKTNWTMKEKLVEKIYEPLSSILEKHAELLMKYSCPSSHEVKAILSRTFYKIQLPFELLERIDYYVDQIEALNKKHYYARRAMINIASKNVLEYLKEKYGLPSKEAISFSGVKILTKSEHNSINFDDHLVYELLLANQKVHPTIKSRHWTHVYEKVYVPYGSKAYNITLEEFDEFIWKKCLNEASKNSEIINMKKGAEVLSQEAWVLIDRIASY